MVERICCVSTWCWCWSRLPKDDWCSTRRRSRKCVHNLSTQQKHTQTYLTFVSSPASLAPVIIFKQNIPLNRWLNLTKWPIDVVLPGSGAQNLSNLPRIMRCQRFLLIFTFPVAGRHLFKHASSTNLSLVQRALSLCKGQVILVERHPRKRKVLSHHCTSVEAFKPMCLFFHDMRKKEQQKVNRPGIDFKYFQVYQSAKLNTWGIHWAGSFNGKFGRIDAHSLKLPKQAQETYKLRIVRLRYVWHPDCDLSQKGKMQKSGRWSPNTIVHLLCVGWASVSCDCPFGLRAVPSEMVTILQITISSQPETKSLGHFLTSNFEPAQFHSSFEAAKTWVLRAPTRYVHKSKYGQLWPLSHISPSLHVDERPQKQETNTWDQLSFLCLNRLNTAYPWWLAKFKYSWQLVVPVSFL